MVLRRYGCVIDRRFGVQDVIEPAHGGGAALEDVGDETQRDHGEDQLDHVGIKSHEFAERDLPEDHLPAAEPQHQDEGHADQRRQCRHEHAPRGDQLEIARDVFAIGRVKGAHLRLFLSVGANNAHAGQIFLSFCGKRGERGLNRFVQGMDDLAEITRDHHDDGDRDENPEAQRRRQAEHQHDGQHHGHNGRGAVHDSGTENHAHGIEVVGGARHQFAGAIAHVELRLHDQQAIE